MSIQSKNSNEVYKQSPEMTQVSPLVYIDALRVAYSKKEEVLAQLDSIASRIPLVSPSVQATVSNILKEELSRIRSGNTITTATILAINPANLVRMVAANDERFASAA